MTRFPARWATTAAASRIILRMPVPPSTNALFVTFRERGNQVGRAKTKEYKAWITAAGLMLNTQQQKPILGRVDVKIYVPRNNRRDLDNHFKAILDLLVGHSLIEDDRRIERLFAEWHDITEDNGVAFVEVVPA